MGLAFDHTPDRPDYIENILNGLDRYNPETTEVFSKYVMEQCENRTYDCYANLALLKLYVPALRSRLRNSVTGLGFCIMTNKSSLRFLLPESQLTL